MLKVKKLHSNYTPILIITRNYIIILFKAPISGKTNIRIYVAEIRATTKCEYRRVEIAKMMLLRLMCAATRNYRIRNEHYEDQ